jgi:catechol-2,3-dioxygenase
VVFVADVPRMARFYRELLSMQVLHDAQDHVVLEC